MVHCNETSVVSLTDDELVLFTADGKTTERLSGPADFSRVAADLFRVPGLAIGEALRIRGLSPVGAGVS